nr:NapC/NirT family cytochrome c [Desulfobulbaceae bacterium]
MADSDKNEQYRGPWGHIVRGMWRSPLGIIGVILTTVCATLMVVGLIVELFGLSHNVYVPLLAFLVLPGGMITGLLLIPLAAFLRRRQWHKHGIAKDHLQVNLSDHKHRKLMIYFVVLTVLFFLLLAVIGYEGYHFSDSPFFCGKVCHQVMEPEYDVYKRSPHSKVVCVECHIGPGAQWFVRAKISGLRQVLAVVTNSHSRPIPAPVEHLRPARDTCENCHWPDKFSGKRIKKFTHFSNSDQETPEVNEIALHIGGHNPVTEAFEGIHWHVSNDVKIEYKAVDTRRLVISNVRVTRPDGSQDEFTKTDPELPEGTEPAEGLALEWRTMDCIDCHNRPTHVFDLPEERVDFGLLSKKINPEIIGIREDSLTTINTEFNTREEAQNNLVNRLVELQTNRHGIDYVKRYEKDLATAGEYLLETYLGNIWPNMNIKWGTYGSHLGHQRAEEGWGCFRCHDEEHVNSQGESITQDCSLCHDEPE